jgi:hypothetical protein
VTDTEEGMAVAPLGILNFGLKKRNSASQVTIDIRTKQSGSKPLHFSRWEGRNLHPKGLRNASGRPSDSFLIQLRQFTDLYN